MKIFLTSVILFFLAETSFAQLVNNQKIDRYCEVICVEKASLFKSRVYLQTGAPDPEYAIKDTAVEADLNKVTALNTRVDVLNYMSRIGWSLAGMRIYGGFHYFVFKRSFDLSELKKLP